MGEKLESPLKVDENAEIEKRRVKIMVINPLAFMGLFSQGIRFKKQTQLVSGIPDDAQLIGITYDTRRDLILMVIQSESFDETPVNEVPPFIQINIQTDFRNTKKKVAPKRKRK